VQSDCNATQRKCADELNVTEEFQNRTLPISKNLSFS